MEQSDRRLPREPAAPAAPSAGATPEVEEPARPRSLLRPVRLGNAFEETIERVLQGIHIGLFPAGERLPPERELSEALGISRATLREALAELQKAGYVDVLRGRYGGTVVARDRPTAPAAGAGAARPPSAREIEDVVIFRRVVEPAAAELAARASLSAASRAHLTGALEAAAAAAENDPGEYRPRDARFHVAIAELAGSESLTAAVADARARTSALLDRIPLLSPNITHSNEQHRRIVDAILRGDAGAARSAAEDHLDGTEALLRGFLRAGPAG